MRGRLEERSASSDVGDGEEEGEDSSLFGDVSTCGGALVRDIHGYMGRDDGSAWYCDWYWLYQEYCWDQ